MSATSNEPEPGSADCIKTYSLAEVAADHLPAEIKDPVRWLSMRLNRGELRGVRMGRYWRMRDCDVEYMLTRYSNEHATPPTSLADALSARSRRRLRARPN